MVLRLTSCSPRRSGLFVTFIGEISFANLTPTIEASGPHDFAVRKSALSSAAQLASIASRPYVRDDRETPLCVGRDGERCPDAPTLASSSRGAKASWGRWWQQ